MLSTLFFFYFFLLQGMGALARSHLPFLPTPEGITASDMVSRSLGLPDSNGVRRPRNAVSVLSLLWPQVVGPIENGIIKEEGYKEIPKTSLENQLEGIRERSRHHLQMRQHVRDLINDEGVTSHLNLQELYALNNDMGGFHPHPGPPIFHPPEYHPYHFYHPDDLPYFDSVVIQDSQLAPFPGFHEIMHHLNEERHPKKLTIHSTSKSPPLLSHGGKEPHDHEHNYGQKKIVTTEISVPHIYQNTDQHQEEEHKVENDQHVSEKPHAHKYDQKKIVTTETPMVPQTVHQNTYQHQDEDDNPQNHKYDLKIVTTEISEVSHHDSENAYQHKDHQLIHKELASSDNHANPDNSQLTPSPQQILLPEIKPNDDDQQPETKDSHENLHETQNVVQLKGMNSENNHGESTTNKTYQDSEKMQNGNAVINSEKDQMPSSIFK